MKWYETIVVHSSVLLVWFWSFKHILKKKGQKAKIHIFYCILFLILGGGCLYLEQRQRKEDWLLLLAFAAASSWSGRRAHRVMRVMWGLVHFWIAVSVGMHSQPTLSWHVPYVLMNIINKMQSYVRPSWDYNAIYSASTAH